MFRFFKENELTVYTPCEGDVVALTELKDGAFSSGALGEGFAVVSREDAITVCAPIDGKIDSIFPTGHALVIRGKTAACMIHFGLDTVNLKGEGITVLVKENNRVKAGAPLIEVNQKLYREARYQTPTIVCFPELEDKHFVMDVKENSAGKIVCNK